MKCVKMTESGEIRKVTDAQGDELVSTGKAKYVSKSEWKAENPRPVKKEKSSK
jgi:hypothetical protein